MSSFAPPPGPDAFIYHHPQHTLLCSHTIEWLTELEQDPGLLEKFMVETAVDVLNGNLEHQSQEPRFWVFKSTKVAESPSERKRAREFSLSFTFQQRTSSRGAVSIIGKPLLDRRTGRLHPHTDVLPGHSGNLWWTPGPVIVKPSYFKVLLHGSSQSLAAHLLSAMISGIQKQELGYQFLYYFTEELRERQTLDGSEVVRALYINGELAGPRYIGWMEDRPALSMPMASEVDGMINFPYSR